ncbi:uncharacterized protein CDV56_100442 [Aspergillus thermomutatus]|uniref:Aminoglycoside phosphotransferase domain-containing protein n=1 Tax=Aspergillus thermomutatus TaxID=41047 RepID=A0A397FWZ2_ASPTH|nr:uncharacterized protein CDV56_100442 [Aspergillus thermomutatus]RHZ43117.1 hypothetical protein CDV56_100442 [Aspergillus thermomutatus]
MLLNISGKGSGRPPEQALQELKLDWKRWPGETKSRPKHELWSKLGTMRTALCWIRSRPCRSMFIHADLHPSNILIARGRPSGIVDWECASFYPEYWEFTKLMYGAERFPEIQQILRDAFPEDSYEEELEVE